MLTWGGSEKNRLCVEMFKSNVLMLFWRSSWAEGRPGCLTGHLPVSLLNSITAANSDFNRFFSEPPQLLQQLEKEKLSFRKKNNNIEHTYIHTPFHPIRFWSGEVACSTAHRGSETRPNSLPAAVLEFRTRLKRDACSWVNSETLRRRNSGPGQG